LSKCTLIFVRAPLNEPSSPSARGDPDFLEKRSSLDSAADHHCPTNEESHVILGGNKVVVLTDARLSLLIVSGENRLHTSHLQGCRTLQCA